MSIFQDLSQLKSSLMDKLTHNTVIVTCINETQISTPENLLYKNIFDSFTLPQDTETKGTFVCFDVFSPEEAEDAYRPFDWRFRIFSQPTAGPVSLNGTAWNRVDGIQRELIQLLEGCSLQGDGAGLDPLHFRACLSYEPNNVFSGKELVFRCLGLHPGGRRGR